MRYPPQPGLMGGDLRWGTQYRTTDGVLGTPRSVCLLRSSRRTVLFKNDFKAHTIVDISDVDRIATVNL